MIADLKSHNFQQMEGRGFETATDLENWQLSYGREESSIGILPGTMDRDISRLEITGTMFKIINVKPINNY